MGVRHLREAFTNASGGQLSCGEALLDTAHDDEGEHSILTFAGTRASGETFRISSRPVRPGEDPNLVAAETAASMLDPPEG